MTVLPFDSARVNRALDVAYAFGMFQRVDEIRAFALWLAQRGVRGPAVEIGAHRGGTSALWCELGFHPVISIDLCSGEWGGIGKVEAEKRDRELARRYASYVHIEGDSHYHLTLASAVVSLPEPASLLFIDGDHSLPGVSEDYRMYSPLVRTSGVVAFHDIADTRLHRERGVEVAQLWASLAGERFEFVDKDGDWGGIGAVIA